MEPERWERIKAVFQEACEREPERQAQYLAQACGDDGELRAAVERLLRAHAGAGSGFLEARASLEPVPPEPCPARIGPYRVVRELGRGGMGTVYLAERDEPGLRKTVAIKVVRRGRESAFVVGRFRTESQILAALEHPGIARLYDGGTTDDGRPYFVMEHVDGQDLLSHCDAARLAIEARVRLFVRVCEAVQYAHQSLVVHRDLKPSNILVTAAGEPKLLDFGIAKLLGPETAQVGSEETAANFRLMTPDFASPEQVRGLRVTTASDVYSLGIVLYELLAGQRPYRLQGSTATEVERVVLEQQPEPPSVVSARARGAPAPQDAISPESVSAQRGTTPAKLKQQLRGDLDNIVLKALRKEPTERYATAADLAEDLRRHLEGLPVRAHPDARPYRLAKFVRRHRAGVAAASIAVLGLVAGLAVALRQAHVAEQERRRAEARFQDVRGLANVVIYELHDAIGDLAGATAVRKLMVARALEYLDRLGTEAHEDLSLQRELADAYQRVAQAQGGGGGANLGDTRGAFESLAKALAIRRGLAAREPAEPQDLLGLSLLEFDLGTLQRTTGDASRAEQSFLSAAARLEALQAAGVLPGAQRGRLGAVYQRLGEAQSFQRKGEQALQSAAKAVAIAEGVLQDAPGDPVSRSHLAAAYVTQAGALAAHDRLSDALAQVGKARTLVEGLLHATPLDARQTRILLFILHAQGSYVQELGDVRTALDVRREALRIAEEALRRDPRDRWSQMAVAVAADALGDTLLARGEPDQAAERFQQALAISRQALAEDQGYEFARLQALSAEYGGGRALLSRGRPSERAEACAALRRVRRVWEGLQSEGRLGAGDAEALAELLRWLERCGPAH